MSLSDGTGSSQVGEEEEDQEEEPSQIEEGDEEEEDDEEDISSDDDDQSSRHLRKENQVEIDQQIEVPKDIELDSIIVDIACHPKRNLIAAGTIDGPVHLYSYATGDTGNKVVVSFEQYKKPCRVVRFSDSGEHLFTGSQDATICVLDIETNSEFRKFSREGGSSLYSILPIDNYLLASGEDDGQVVLWDFRMQAPIECFEDCDDYISSLVINRDKKILLATSGDGIVCTYNVRAKKLEMRSEDFDSDLLCAGIFKGGTKVAIGAGDGSLNIFNWGEFGNISDRFPGHPGSVDSMAVLGEDVICTGCEDGKIRAVQLFPNRFLGVLGSHHGFPVERLSLFHDLSLLASSSYDQKIKFWDLSGVEDLKSEDVKDTKKKHRQLNKQVNDFFADMV